MSCSNQPPPQLDENYGADDLFGDIAEGAEQAGDAANFLDQLSSDLLDEFARVARAYEKADAIMDLAEDGSLENHVRVAGGLVYSAGGATTFALGAAGLIFAAGAFVTVPAAGLLTGLAALAGGIVGWEEWQEYMDEHWESHPAIQEYMDEMARQRGDMSRSTNGSDGRTPGSECGDPNGGNHGAGGFGDLQDNPPASPLIVDMDGDGIELLSLFDSSAMFDLDADGFAELTGWVSSDDALLAIDLNGNGEIDDINELFGNATTDGFIELSAYDSNSDGLITSADTQFGDILVWQDANENGISVDSTELKTLTEAGIAAIDLNYTSVNQTNAGHDVTSVSNVALTAGGTRDIADVWFEHNQTNSDYKLPDNFVYDTDVFTLPQLRGFGDVTDLWVAMTNDGGLLALVQNLVDADYTNFDFTDFSADVEAILLRWTGTHTVDPTSRGPNVDARHLEAAEAWQGRPFDASPLPNLGTAFAAEWSDFVANVAARFLVQLPMAPLWEALAQSLDIMQQFEAGGENLDDLTPAEVDTLLDPAFGLLQTDLAGHSLVRFKVLEYDFVSNEFIGTFADFVAMLEANEPASSGEKQTYWQDLLPLINAVADTQEVTDADYKTELTGTYLDTITSDDLVTLRTGNILIGTDGNDSIESGRTDDYIVGGLGDDTLKGDGGDDIYAWNLGDGDDIIEDQQRHINNSLNDKLLLGPGIDTNNIVLTRTLADPEDLVVSVSGQPGSITLQRHFESIGALNSATYEIEQLQFNDGTTWTAAHLENLLLVPTSGDDLLLGYRHEETIDGGDGNDTIYGGSQGDDTLIGGNGDDLIDQREASSIRADNVIDGGAGNDTIYGDFGEDSIDGGSGNDVIDGGFENDTISGGDGNDSIDGGSGSGGFGRDVIDGGAGQDTLTGEGSDDTFIFSGLTHSTAAAPDQITDFEVGDDLLDVSNLGFTTLTTNGTTGAGELRLEYESGTNRTFVRTNQGDFEFYLDGDYTGTLTAADFIFDDDTLPGGGGDTIVGTAGDDSLTGTAADELIQGLGGNDTINGDTVGGSGGADTIEGGDGKDFVQLWNGDGLAYGGNDKDTLLGANGNDTLEGDDGNDKLQGNKGNDSLVGGNGNDNMLGKADDDILKGGADHDIMDGGSGNDFLLASSGNDTVFGDLGDDTLDGGSGTDTMAGQAGVDLLTGGSEADIFWWFATTDSQGNGAQYDTLTDFEAGLDLLNVSIAGFTTLVAGGSTSSATELRTFQSGGNTHVRNDQTDFEFVLTGLYTLGSADFVFA